MRSVIVKSLEECDLKGLKSTFRKISLFLRKKYLGKIFRWKPVYLNLWEFDWESNWLGSFREWF